MTRAEGVQAVRASTAGQFPSTESLRRFAEYLGMTMTEVITTFNAFVNRDIFEFENDRPVYRDGALVHRFPLE